MNLLSAPRQPFVGLAIAAATGIALADLFPIGHAVVLPVVAIVTAGAFVLLRQPTARSTYAFVVGAFFLLHHIRTTDTAGARLVVWLGDHNGAVTVTGSVITEPKIARNGFATFLLKLSSIEIESKIKPSTAPVFVRWRGNPELGDELKLFGIIEPVAPPRNPGEFDMRAYLVRHDVRRAIFVRYAENGIVVRRAGGNPILVAAQKARGWMQRTICRGLEDSPDVQTFLSGVVLGQRHQAPEDIEEPFQQTGTLHLFAVAGLHVGIVARLLWTLATTVQLSRRWATALIIPALLFYAAITGLHVSSMRAALMSSILLGGFFFERKVFSLNSLAAAAFFLLCWNTNELFATGFQLSFAVVGAIILFSDPLATLFRRWTAPDPFLPPSLIRGPRRVLHAIWNALARGLSVSAAAWLGSVLLILWYFYLIAPISLVANLVVVPIAFFVLALAMLSLICAPVLPWLSIVFNNANWCLARAVISAVQLFAQIPGGHYYVEHPHWPNESVATLDILDLGVGAAIHLQATGNNWLFDCGGERDYERVLRQYLHARGVNRTAGLVLTHGDAQHIGGAERLLIDMQPSVVFDNAAPDRSRVHRQLRVVSKNFRPVASGDDFRLSNDVTAKIFFPPPGLAASTADDQALVIQLLTPSARILLMSDSGALTEQALLAAGVDLRSDIIIKGQNHSHPSPTDAFLDAVRPKLIIATSRDFPESEKISDETAARIGARGIKLFRQDETGAVQLRCRAKEWEARAYVTGEIFRSSSR